MSTGGCPPDAMPIHQQRNQNRKQTKLYKTIHKLKTPSSIHAASAPLDGPPPGGVQLLNRARSPVGWKFSKNFRKISLCWQQAAATPQGGNYGLLPTFVMLCRDLLMRISYVRCAFERFLCANFMVSFWIISTDCQWKCARFQV